MKTALDLRWTGPDVSPSGLMMRAAILAFLIGCTGSAAFAATRPPLYDPVSLNIGLACQWQKKCMRSQQKAMKRALGYVKKADPPAWRIHLCNRNASRKRGRVDWVGFDNCIRNAALPRPRPAAKRRTRPLT